MDERSEEEIAAAIRELVEELREGRRQQDEHVLLLLRAIGALGGEIAGERTVRVLEGGRDDG